jgi:hypothetical protein
LTFTLLKPAFISSNRRLSSSSRNSLEPPRTDGYQFHELCLEASRVLPPLLVAPLDLFHSGPEMRGLLRQELHCPI